jgi:hypothetical protein
VLCESVQQHGKGHAVHEFLRKDLAKSRRATRAPLVNLRRK